MGQSAGSSAVHILTLSPLTKGLIHRAIAQSFNYINRPLSTLADTEQAGQRSMGDRSIEQMRALSVQELAQIRVSAGPIADGYVIQGNMLDTLQAGRQNDVDLISGMVTGDSSMFGFFRSGGMIMPIIIPNIKMPTVIRVIFFKSLINSQLWE